MSFLLVAKPQELLILFGLLLTFIIEKKNADFQLKVSESIEVILQSPKREPLLSKT